MKNKIQNNIHCHTTHLPLVSIGIPTFNRPELLRQALESARSQTYPNLEILVSDNESTDAQTSKILAEASAIDFRIKTYRQKKNIGATANFEFLLRSATGEFFTWVADDDVLHPTCIELLVAAHTQNPSLACVFSDVTTIDITGNSLGIKSMLPSGIRRTKVAQKTYALLFFPPLSAKLHMGYFELPLHSSVRSKKPRIKTCLAVLNIRS